MRIDVLTVFPEMIEQAASHSIVRRARESGALDVRVKDLRDFTHDRHRSTDDSPYGGGAGMVMRAGPVAEALEEALKEPSGARCIILMTPQGERLTQGLVEEIAGYDTVAIVCGRYEGVDERVREHLVDREISIGDYVLTGGELPALVLMDAVARLQPGVLGCAESAEDESFSSGLLEYPHYTRPEEFRGWKVPEVLLSGNHAEIAAWRRRESLRRTLERRPDLLVEAQLSAEDIKVLLEMGANAELFDSIAPKSEN